MKVLILTAKAGGGHLAMSDALLERFSDVDCRIVRLGEFARAGFEPMVNRSYIWLVSYAKRPYHFLYKRFDGKGYKKLMRDKQRLNTGKPPKVSLAFQRGSMARLKKLLERERPDVVISCYHYCNILAYKVRFKYKMDFKIINILADYVVNSVYYSHLIDAHICSSEIDQSRLLNIGIPKDKIHELGIPVRRKFFQQNDREPLYEHFGLPTRKTVVLLGGAFGGGKMLDMARSLLAELSECNIVVLCGSNKKLLLRLNKLAVDNNNLFAVPFTSEIDKYMDVADVLVSKVGGNGISEAFAKRLPIVMVNPLPGQECFNAEYLSQKNMAIYARTTPQAIAEVTRLLQEGGNDLKENIDKYFKKDAAESIAALAKSLVANR